MMAARPVTTSAACRPKAQDRGRSERYATAAFLLLHRATGEVTYVNAGHNPPLVAGAASVQLDAPGVPLGLFPCATYEAHTTALSPGGTLLLYTDGLTDAIAGDAPER